MLLKGATVATFDPPLVERADLRIADGRVAERRASLAPQPGEEVVDVTGCVIVPGLVNGHTHLYSALARGMPGPKAHPRNFVEILERVWWRLDRALDEEGVYVSALLGGMEAALSGTTVLVDHHSSPSFIRGSLGTIRRALEEVGLRSVLCYETTDRNGAEGRDLGLAENEDFLARGQSEWTRAMVGAHASFTLGEDTLARLGEAVKTSGSSVHVHVAEDAADVQDCQTKHGTTLLERLGRHGLVGSRALLAHCVHLGDTDIADAHSRGAWIAHNPRSNMNNTVGYARVDAMKRAALGTDGMDEDMLAEVRAAFLQMREAGRADAYGAAVSLLAGGHRLAAALFGLPFGKVDAGGPADLVVLAYDPPTPLHTDNLAGHLLFGMDRSHVASVMVGGRFVVRDRRLVNVDPRAVAERARPAAQRLWEGMQEL